ncbi:hypothetical protein Scep_025068 [Stephania cephalantha]|uniref:Late embryogenesis abundant protein n=1 Tax=Stephania cephalantha TaxID=152367 RepID=A0AAP0HU83_9MAGN
MSSIKSLCRLSSRCYSVVATEIGSSAEQKAMSAGKAKNVSSGGAVTEEKQVFWMRDPKTGYWVPENHFDDVDVCDLRKKFLFK